MRDEFGNGQTARSAGEELDPALSPPEADEPRVVREVYGSQRNIERLGSPIGHSETESLRYFFYPTWRSQLMNLLGFVGLSVVCVFLSRMFPMTVLPGKLISFGDRTLVLHFPLLIFGPGFLLGRILVNVYDAKYVIDDGGVEAQIGLVSMNLRQPRLRWEDIRGSEPQQTLWERMLGIGTVGIGSAMTQDVEIVMTGVASPRAIQLLIQGERDRRLQELRTGNRNAARAAAIVDD